MDCFNNQGSIVGHRSLNINANNLTNENGGLIKGDYVQLGTKNNLNNLSATIGADSTIQLDVGGDFNNQSLTYSTETVKGASNSTRTGISQIASIYVGDGLKGQVNEKGKPLTTFTANVGGDTTFAAGRLDNQGGSSVIDTKGNVKLDAVNVGYQSNSIGDANNYYKESASQDIGSQLRSNDDVIITGNNISGTAVNINSDNGSNLNISNNALFQADNNLNVNGVAQNSNTRSNNKNSSTAIGAYASTGNGMGITASASRGKGYANSDSTTYANSEINVGGTTTFDIGNDVNIKGGVINTDRAQGAIGGDVTIESLQDTATYDSKQKNMGFNADIDIAGAGAGSSLSVNGGKTNLNADYKAVGEQSGIFTGDGGFDLTAKGKTTLIGGAITTTEAARDAGRNNYESLGGITTQDIENTTSYDGDAISVGLSVGNTDNKPQASMNGLGYGTDSDSDSSVTRAGITGIAGNKDITTDNRAEYQAS